MRVTFGDAWYSNPGAALRPVQLRQVHDAKQSLILSGKPVDPPRVVANLSLGFWVGLFGPKYETSLWRNHLRWIFDRAPTPLRRRAVHERLDRIRMLRNRVAHYEPVLHLPLAQEFRAILELIAWLCFATSVHTARRSQLEAVLQNRPTARDPVATA